MVSVLTIQMKDLTSRPFRGKGIITRETKRLGKKTTLHDDAISIKSQMGLSLILSFHVQGPDRFKRRYVPVAKSTLFAKPLCLCNLW